MLKIQYGIVSLLANHMLHAHVKEMDRGITYFQFKFWFHSFEENSYKEVLSMSSKCNSVRIGKTDGHLREKLKKSRSGSSEHLPSKICFVLLSLLLLHIVFQRFETPE